MNSIGYYQSASTPCSQPYSIFDGSGSLLAGRCFCARGRLSQATVLAECVSDVLFASLRLLLCLAVLLFLNSIGVSDVSIESDGLLPFGTPVPSIAFRLILAMSCVVGGHTDSF